MNTINLDEHFRIESDSVSWNLVYEKIGPERNDKGDFVTSRNTSYHATLKQTLTTYLDRSLKPSTDVQGVINRIREVEQRIAQL